ncbi:putative membrane protein [Caulobacter ginsengisoli]|uniref:Membrane protein n=1 Tax=Caulobacter ginsengisoli TaxID=400775 RepID=A0ABU0IMQ0_9CAUL|nr:putative membrane protein [Caulobacter ginsengisoli]
MAAILALASISPAWSQTHPGGGGGYTSKPSSGSGMVNVHLCNKTSLKIYVALGYRESIGSNNWIVEGWKNISPYSCFDIRVPNDSVIYDYAEDDEDGSWGGDFQLCVQHPGPFRRVNSGDYTCDAKELKGFATVDVTGLADKTVNFNP